MSTNYRINAVVTSHGDQLRADMRRNVGSLTEFDRKIAGSSRQMGVWGRQMQAMATTIRYAFAGAVIYGVARAVNGLGEFEKQLGQIDSLIGTIGKNGKWDTMGLSVERFGDEALKMSNKYGIAVGDVLSSQERFASTFSRNDETMFARGAAGAKKYNAEMLAYTDTLSRLQLIAEGASATDMGNALGGFAASLNIKNPGDFAKRFLNMWAYVRAKTPTLTGVDLARDVGVLGQGAQITGMTPTEVMALYGIAQQSGGTPATTARGLRQLLTTSVLHPTKKESVKAYNEAVGTSDPTELRKIGGLEVLRRLLTYVAPNGTTMSRAQKAILTDETLDPGEAAQEAQLRGVNLTRAYTLFGRSESTRGFLTLLSQGGPDAIQKFIDGLNDAQRDMLGIRQTDIANSRNYWAQIKQAQANLPMQIIRGPLAPVMKRLAQGVRGASDFTVDHPHIAQGVVLGTLGAVAASRLLMGKGVLQNIPGPLGKLLGRSASSAGALAMGAGLGAFDSKGLGTRADPMWVVIDPISWLAPAAPSSTNGGGAGGTGLPPVVAAGGKWGSRLARGSIAAAAAIGIYETYKHRSGLNEFQDESFYPWLDKNIPGMKQIHNLLGVGRKKPPVFAGSFMTQLNNQRNLTLQAQKMLGPNATVDMLNNQRNQLYQQQQGRVQVEGNSSVEVRVKLVDSKGRALTEERVHVNTKLIPSGDKPQSRGKKKSMRSGTPVGPH